MFYTYSNVNLSFFTLRYNSFLPLFSFFLIGNKRSKNSGMDLGLRRQFKNTKKSKSTDCSASGVPILTTDRTVNLIRVINHDRELSVNKL